MDYNNYEEEENSDNLKSSQKVKNLSDNNEKNNLENKEKNENYNSNSNSFIAS